MNIFQEEAWYGPFGEGDEEEKTDKEDAWVIKVTDSGGAFGGADGGGVGFGGGGGFGGDDDCGGEYQTRCICLEKLICWR